MKNKYRNRRTTIEGITFSSLREAERYCALALLQRSGLIRDLTLQPRFPLVVEGVKICTYVADFSYHTADNVLIVEDAKGYKTEVYKLKRKLMFALYKIDIKEV